MLGGLVKIINEMGGWINPLPPAIRDEVLAATTQRTYTDGELIYTLGDSSEVSYLIEEGKVKLCVLTPDGREFMIAILEKDHSFGEQGAIDDSLRMNSAYAMGSVRLRILPKASLSRLRQDHPEIAESLLKFINYRLRLMLTYIYGLVFASLQQQLAARLLLIAKSSGESSPNGVEIQTKLTQEDLAKLTGASRQSINKEFKELQKKNIIEVNSKKITILDMAALEAISQVT